MQQYKDLMCELLETATFKEDRTGVNTVAKFGHQIRFNLQEGFPLVTLKHTPFHLIVKELLWFLEGNTNAHDLAEQGCHIWDNWALENGELGPIYGKQWRSWQAPDTNAISARIARIDEILNTAVDDHPLDVDKDSLTEARKLLVEMREHDATRTIDQIREVIDQIKRKPHSRRLIVSAWNPADMPDESQSPQDNVREGRMALAACHTLFQFYVSDGKLSCQLYQRSCDTALGLPFNIASYALLTHMIAQCCNLGVGEFIWTGGDVHVYLNHLDGVKEMVQREPLPLPTLKLNDMINDIDAFTLDDIKLEGYESHPTIKFPIAV